MRSLYSKIGFLILCAFLIACSNGANAENEKNHSSGQTIRFSDEQRNGLPYVLYSPSEAEVILDQAKINFIDTYIDPADYIVGPGDQFSVLFTSNNISNISTVVNSDGTIFLKSIGTVDLFHISLEKALETIVLAVGKNYTGSGFAVVLSKVRTTRINVLGEVEKPGVYYAPASWRVSEVIDLAGGITATGSLRNIILDGFGHSSRCDLVKYRHNGDLSSNRQVAGGNTITVAAGGSSRQAISISGPLFRPGIFEFVPGDRLSDVLSFAGGVKGDISEMEIVIFNSNREEDKIIDGSNSDMLEGELEPGDKVKLLWKKDRKSFGTVDIFGAIRYPGRFNIPREGYRLSELLAACGGLNGDSNREAVTVYRRAWNQMADGSQNLYEGSLLHGKANRSISGRNRSENQAPIISLNPRNPRDLSEIEIIDDDSIYVPTHTGMISVMGAVAAPGLIAYQKGKDVEYYLNQAGGLGFDADRGKMIVLNPLTGGRIDASRAGELFDGEILVIPQREGGANR